MNPNALKAALGKLLDHGERSKDNSMKEMAKRGKAPAPDLCPECKMALVDGGKCPKCGYVKPMEGMDEGESGDMAELLEKGGE